MITLVQLQYIVAIDTYRHFATAAQKCFVTQPTLSMQVKKLEEYLDILIFDRSKQPVVPTDVGQEIIRQARIVLKENQKIEELIAHHKGIVAGNLRLAIIPSLAPYLLPLFVGNFIKKYPLVHLQVVEMLSEDIIVALQKDTIDAALLVTPLREDSLIEKPLFYEKIMVYTNQNHVLAQKKEIALADLITPQLWLLSQGHCFRHQVLNLCSYQSIRQHELPFEYESGSLDTLIRLVDKEGGFTLLPELAVFEVKNQALIKNFEQKSPLREVSLVVSRHFVKQKLVEIVGQEIQNALPYPMLDKNRGTLVDWR